MSCSLHNLWHTIYRLARSPLYYSLTICTVTGTKKQIEITERWNTYLSLSHCMPHHNKSQTLSYPRHDSGSQPLTVPVRVGLFTDKVALGQIFLTVFHFFLTYALQPSRLIVRSGLDVPTFVTRCLHRCHHARAPSGRRWNCGREMSKNFA
jgi:hypothetical protein